MCNTSLTLSRLANLHGGRSCSHAVQDSAKGCYIRNDGQISFVLLVFHALFGVSASRQSPTSQPQAAATDAQVHFVVFCYSAEKAYAASQSWLRKFTTAEIVTISGMHVQPSSPT